MYRKPGSQSALSGVTSGPYTGDARRIDAELLAPATRTKIARALRSIGEPSPIAMARRAPFLTKSAIARMLIVVCTVLLFVLWMMGYQDAESPWARQPLYVAPIYGLLGALWMGSISIANRARFLSGPDSLPPGKYLFSLDIVEVSNPDETGRQQLRVRPLGNARDAKIELVDGGKRADLVIHFADLTTERFPLSRNDKTGERALRGLEHAQSLLEELTYKQELERAFVFDLFFDLRADRSWAAVAPDGAPMSKRSAAAKAAADAAEGEGAKRRKKVALAVAKVVHHRITPFLSAALGLVVGMSIFEWRRATGDQFLLMRAWYRQTPEALDQYVANGGLRPEVAQRYKENIVRARLAEEEERKKSVAVAVRDKVAAAKTGVDCIEALRAKRAATHPSSVAIVEQIIHRAERSYERKIPVVFVRNVATTPDVPAGLPSDEALRTELEDREKVLVDAFSKVFAETCPTSIITWEWLANEHEAFRSPVESGGLSVTYSVGWEMDRLLEASSGSAMKIRPLTIDFTEVALRAPAGAPAPAIESFKLRIASPPSPSASMMRPRSLYVLTNPTPSATTIYSTLTARAFDRLYDEIYTLFFEGEPRVPLRPGDLHPR